MGGLRCRRVTDARSLLSVSPPPLVPPLLRVGLMRPTVGMTADLNSHAVERESVSHAAPGGGKCLSLSMMTGPCHLSQWLS